jgi:coproporphyrinogen III oxidase
MASFVRELQLEICKSLESVDSVKFKSDEWQREEGGGGISCVLQNGKTFEKAGVNVSVVYGKLSKATAQQMSTREMDVKELDEFYATGISLVIHPHNPMAPTVHLNYRYFEIAGEVEPKYWWFGLCF